MTVDSFRSLKSSFKRLQGRLAVRKLRAEYQQGGWGKSVLQPETIAPTWYLVGSDDAQTEFCSIATEAARFAGFLGNDAWIAWLDLARAKGLAKDRNGINWSIPDVCYASIQLCALRPRLESGAPAAGAAMPPQTEYRRRFRECQQMVKRAGGGALTMNRFANVMDHEDTTQLRHLLNGSPRASHKSIGLFNRAIRALRLDPHLTRPPQNL